MDLQEFATVTGVGNFVDENVFLFYIVKAPRPVPVHSVNHCLTRQICQSH